MSTLADGGDGDESTANIHIPNCLLLEILNRLPIKSIFQFKCVSKTCLSLINNPSFFQNYHCHSHDGLPPWFLFSRFVEGFSNLDDHLSPHLKGKHFIISENPFFQYTIPFPSPQPVPFRCIASSRDLLLLVGSLNYIYYVCNPLTKQCIRLPRLRIPNGYSRFGIGLSSRVIAGVAHYKVVRIGVVRRIFRKKVLRIDIFSSETGEWRNKEVEMPLELPIQTFCSYYRKKSVTLNGIIHWLGRADCIIIIAYNTKTTNDELRLIDVPRRFESARISFWNVVLDVWQGRLRYFELDDSSVPGKFPGWCVWVLVDYAKGEWCLEHRGYYRDISSLDAQHPVLFLQRRIDPIGFHPLNMDLMYFWCGKCIFKYNLRSGLFEGVYHEEEHYPPSMGWLSWFGVFSVIPSPLPTPIALPSWETEEEEKGFTRKLLKRIVTCCWS